jgi:hypothetical protein
VSDSASSKNYLNYSTAARCVNENLSPRYTVRLNYVIIYYPSVNVSMNKCYSRSGIFCYPYPVSNSVACSFTYSSFVDNNATGYTCIRFNRNDAKHEIKCCNIVRNTQVTLGTEGTFYSNANVMINDSCILENKANCIFYSDSSSYTFTLSNCTVDKTTYNQNLIMQNTITKSFILALNHMFTQNCNTGYDSAGTLTPVTLLPSSKKQIHLCTCGKYFFQPSPHIFLFFVSLYFSI